MDEEISEILDGQQSMETAFDSIMDDSQDEEDEVNDLLVSD